MPVGFRRNAALLILMVIIVLPSNSPGETPSPADPPFPDIQNTDPQCVLQSRKVLEEGESQADPTIPVLIDCLKGDYYYFERGAAKTALARIGRPAVPALVEALDHPEFFISEEAATTLGMIGPPAKEAVGALVGLLSQKDRSLGLAPKAAKALGRIGEIELLIRILQGQEQDIQPYLGAQGLAAAGPAAAPAVPVLMETLESPDKGLQMHAAEALGEIGPAANPAVPRLAELSNSSWNFLRRAAGEALLKIGTPEAETAGKPYKRRKELFDGFFSFMSVFVWNPLFPLGAGMILGVLGFWGSRIRPERKGWIRVLYGPAAAWILYAAWEFYMKQIGANIRVDLLLIYPVLAVLTLLGLAAGLTGLLLKKTG